jgi:hypothetical protein
MLHDDGLQPITDTTSIATVICTAVSMSPSATSSWSKAKGALQFDSTDVYRCSTNRTRCSMKRRA